MTPPPIASPHSPEDKPPTNPPFLGLQIFVGLDLVVLFIETITDIYRHQPHQSWSVSIVVYVIYLPLWCLLLWYLWRGSGTARAIFCSLNTLSALFFIAKGFKIEGLPLWLRWLNYASEAFIIFSVIWLQLPGVKSHFRRDKSV